MAAVKRSLNIGVVGLGNMGVPIARNLAFKGRGGLYLHLYSRSPAKARRVSEDLAVDGAACAMRLHHRYGPLLKWCDVILLTLATRQAAAGALLEDSDALLRHARPGQLFVDHTTVDVGLSRACAAAAEGRGATFLDAPMSGSPRAAFNGQLTLMVGGPAEAFQRLQPIFRMYADSLHHMGGSGAGSAAKLLSQALVASHNAAAAEAMTLANRLGIEDQTRLVQVLDASWGSSTMLRRNAPMMQDLVRNPDKMPPTSGATVDHLLGDLSLLDASLRKPGPSYSPDSNSNHKVEEEEEEKFPVLDSALRMLGAASEAGMGDRDLSAVIHFVQAAVAIEREERQGTTPGQHPQAMHGSGGSAVEPFEIRGLTAGAFLTNDETGDPRGGAPSHPQAGNTSEELSSSTTTTSPSTAPTIPTKNEKDSKTESYEFTCEDFY